MQLTVITGNESFFTRLANNGVARTPAIIGKSPAAAGGNTTPSVHTLADKAQISDTAKAAEAAKAASDVSKAQGLPDGKYDFSRMSPQQLYDVTNDMVLNKHVDPADIKPLTDLIGNPRSPSYNSPTNFSRAISDLKDGYTKVGNTASAAQIGKLQIYMDKFTFVDPTTVTGPMV